MNRLTILATEIADLHHGFSLRPSLEAAQQIGEKLLKAKAMVGHGQWLPWLKSLGIRVRTAQVYMQVAQEEPPEGVVSIDGFLRHMKRAKKAAIKANRADKIAAAVAEMDKVGTDTVKVVCCDNRTFDWPELDHIFTDPPWGQWEHYRWLAEMAEEKLKPGGLLAVQCGAPDIARVLPIFKRFKYLWTLAIVYAQSGGEFSMFLPTWSPLLLFSQGEPNPFAIVSDVATVNGRESRKEWHDWQQPLAPFVRWITGLTAPGALIGDPYSGTGTIATTCKLTGRRCLATEIEEEMVAVARSRIAGCDSN